MVIAVVLLGTAMAVAGDVSVHPTVSSGTDLAVSTARIPRRSGVSEYGMRAMTVDMPKAVKSIRKSDIYRHAQLETYVLDFVKNTFGAMPSNLVVKTAGLPPGDYCGRVLYSCYHPFAFHVHGDVPEVSLKVAQRQRTDGVSWAMTNDVDFIRIRAKAPKGRPAVLLLDPDNTGRTVYRIVFREDGAHEDAIAVDDNTNNDRFTVSKDWTSHVEQKAKVGATTWSLDAVLPFGAFPTLAGTGSGTWRVKMSTEINISPPRDYCHVPVPFDPSARHAWDVPTLRTQVIRGTNGLHLAVTPVLRNGTPEFRIMDIALVAKTVDGRELDRVRRTLCIRAGQALPVETCLAEGKIRDGDVVVICLSAFSAEGALEMTMSREARISYSPVSIRMEEPCYRDNVYETMRLRQLRGAVIAEEGFGRPARVVLEGPGTRETLDIPCLAPTNDFVFPFVGKAKGDYFIKVGRTVKRIRNLPYRKGEVWIDGNGVIHRDGEKMFPFGWYSETYRHMYPGINISQTYSWFNTDTNKLVEMVSRVKDKGCALVLHATQSLSKIPRDSLFGEKISQGDFDAKPHGEERRRTLERFASLMRDQEGFFCHYLVDEPEGTDRNPGFYRRMHEIVAEADPYHPTMMVNFTDEGVRRFKDCADILCPDSYPVYLEDGGVLGSRLSAYQRSLVATQCGISSMFTPQVFDWNYTAPGRIPCGPKYEDIRQQCFMALAGGAKGLLLFSRFSWSTPSEHLRMGPEMVIREILESRDVFLAPSEILVPKLVPAIKDFVAVCKRDGAELLVIAFNASAVPVQSEISAVSLPPELYLGGEKKPIIVKNGVLTDRFSPRELKIYHSVPKKFSFVAANKRIAEAEKARRKPGNLAIAPRFLTWGEMARAAKGELELSCPRVSVSSARCSSEVPLPAGYLLQDGFAEEYPYQVYHAWRPDDKDANPTVRIEFGEKKTFDRIVLTRVRTEDKKWPVRAVEVEANGRKIAKGAFKDGVLELTFPEVKSSEIIVHVTDADRTVACGWLSEIEVY